MKIIILGAGRIGFRIAESLIEERHDITLIDISEAALKKASNSLDVLTLQGNGASAHIQEEAGIHKADIFLAVTSSDEVNIVSCIVAKQLGAKTKVARVRNPEYLSERILTAKALGIDMVINPERQVALELSRLIRNPFAINSELFVHTKVQLLEIKVEEDSPWAHQPLSGLRLDSTARIMAVVHDFHTFLPTSDYIPLPGDHLYILIPTENIQSIAKLLGKPKKSPNVLIVGGGLITSHLLRNLERYKIPVKVLEQDPNLCHELAEQFPKTLILHGNGADVDLLKAEGIDSMDDVVAVTASEEQNILVALLAKSLGAKRVLAQIGSSYQVPLVETIGIDVAINMNAEVVNRILHFVRRQEVLSVSVLEEGAELMEMIIKKDARILKKPLKTPRFLPDALLGLVIREDKVLYPQPDMILRPDDVALVLALKPAITDVEAYFRGR